jgi:predicted nucleic acid-binding Zn ribbon protein
VERLLPRFGVIYKGSGFYTTEYKRKGNQESSAGKDGD